MGEATDEKLDFFPRQLLLIALFNDDIDGADPESPILSGEKSGFLQFRTL